MVDDRPPDQKIMLKPIVTHRLDAIAAVQGLHVLAEPEHVEPAMDFPRASCHS